MKRLAIGLAASILLLAVPAYATKGLKPGPVKLDPALGYVLVRIGPSTGKKFKAPALYLSRFDPATSEARTRKRKDPARVTKGEDSMVTLGDRVFMPGERTSIFIASLTPGEWVVHGSYTTCLCLGSYRFTVAPGQITDLGSAFIGSEAGGVFMPELVRKTLAPDLEERPYAVPDAIAIKPAAEGDALPPEVAALPLKRAEYVSDVRFTNRSGLRYLYNGGILVNRAAGLPKPESGDAKLLVERVMKTTNDTEVVAKPVLEGEEPKPLPDTEPTAAPAP